MQLLFLFMLLNFIILATIIYVLLPFLRHTTSGKITEHDETTLFIIIIIIKY